MADASVKVAYSSAAIVHIGSGTSLAAAVINPSSDISTALSSTNLGRYPRADVVLTYNHTATMAPASTAVHLYRRDINVDGTADDPTPNTVAATIYKGKYCGSFVATPQSATSASHSQTFMVVDVPLTDQCEFYIDNSTNTSILAGWTLKITPKTDVGATS